MRLRLSRWTVGALVLAVALVIAQSVSETRESADNADGLAPVTHSGRATPGSAARRSSLLPVESATATLVTRTDGLSSRLSEGADITDLFTPMSFKPPPQAAAPPPKPVAPRFPYAIAGAIEDGGARQVFLSNDERVLVVKAADTIDGVYRVERVDARGMTVTYLPLGQEQLIPLGP
jgi:hypothetical protein